MPSRSRWCALLASVVLLSCGPDMPADHPEASGQPDASRPGAPPSFDVHEWGLLDVTAGSARLLAGPASIPRPESFSPLRKPVVYFHLAPGAPAFDVDVAVTVPAGSFVEHFPDATLSGDGASLAWTGLRVGGEPCGVREVPARESPACATPDGICEAADLANYAAADTSCIRRGDTPYNHLFYRANGPPPALPFDVASDGADLVIGHTRAPDLIGSIVYVHDEAGSITVSVIDPPPIGDSVKVPPPTSTDASGARRAMNAAMMVAGLTSGESAAFERAWSVDLFGGDAARDMPERRGPAVAPRDFILFAMPPSLADGVSTLSFTPAAHSVKRYLVVRLHV